MVQYVIADVGPPPDGLSTIVATSTVRTAVVMVGKSGLLDAFPAG